MSNNLSNTKRLAKNTIIMYMRMAIVMLVSLYTSRIILRTLGIEDFGIYNVVGSIVVMFDSLRTIFCSSTQRYINFEMGKGNKNALNLVFNLSLKINFFIGVIFFVVAEIVGLWFINYHINIPAEKFFAAHCVFQISIISALLGLIITTFDAIIIAHERMNFYAVISIVSVFFRLAIAFSLPLFSNDRLIYFALLVLFDALVMSLIKVCFCKLNFHEVVVKNVWDKKYFKEMTVFAGWNFFGNTAFALTQNGLNMVLNVFGGPIVNAARGIAYQVNNALQQLVNNISIVIKPFAIQTYAEGNHKKAYEILYLSSKIYFTVQLLVVVVFTFFCADIINLWLGQVPQYVVSFLTIILWYSLIRALHNPIDILFYSVGDMKYYQFFEGICLSLPVLISYFVLKYGSPFYSVFLIQFVIEIINFVAITIIAKSICGLNIKDYFKSVYIPCILGFLVYFIHFWILLSQNEPILIKAIFAVSTSVLILITMFFIGCNKDEKNIVTTAVRNFIK